MFNYCIIKHLNYIMHLVQLPQITNITEKKSNIAIKQFEKADFMVA